MRTTTVSDGCDWRKRSIWARRRTPSGPTALPDTVSTRSSVRAQEAAATMAAIARGVAARMAVWRIRCLLVAGPPSRDNALNGRPQQSYGLVPIQSKEAGRAHQILTDEVRAR